ncbi:VOC family protein [Microbacterium sp.]|uniref:VOC family protein n=1 Tax=Microbacterium sp. TaxID=51671 RepID=UPI003A926A17
MALRGLHHTGIIVRNLDRSVYFYHDLLGLEFASEPSPWFSGDELATGVGVPDASLRQVNLRLGDDIVELLEYGNRPGDNQSVPPQNRLGSMHVAFRVDDIAQTMRVLGAKGITFLSDANVVDEGTLAGWRWVYFHDPDGITIELVEEAYTTPHEEAITAYLRSRRPLEHFVAAGELA